METSAGNELRHGEILDSPAGYGVLQRAGGAVCNYVSGMYEVLYQNIARNARKTESETTSPAMNMN